MKPRNQAEDIARHKGEDYEEWKFADKWSFDIEGYGYTQIPNLLIYEYTKLKLKPAEFLVLVTIESYRWYDNKLPYPSVETLAKNIGITPRNVTRIVTSLEKKGLIERIKRKGTSNAYSIEPLIKKLDTLANNVTPKGQSWAKTTENNVSIEGSIISPKEDEVNKTNLINTKVNKIPDTLNFTKEEIALLTFSGPTK